MSPDMINGMIEFFGCLMALNNCRVLWQAKAVAGVSILSTTFFNVWGVWNLYYYPSLDQWWSFSGGVALVTANTLYIILLIKFSKLRLIFRKNVWYYPQLTKQES